MEQDTGATPGDHYTTFFRQYDARLGRWWGIDPVTNPSESPYAAMGNNPIGSVDPSGADTGDVVNNPPGGEHEVGDTWTKPSNGHQYQWRLDREGKGYWSYVAGQVLVRGWWNPFGDAVSGGSEASSTGNGYDAYNELIDFANYSDPNANTLFGVNLTGDLYVRCYGYCRLLPYVTNAGNYRRTGGVDVPNLSDGDPRGLITDLQPRAMANAYLIQQAGYTFSAKAPEVSSGSQPTSLQRAAAIRSANAGTQGPTSSKLRTFENKYPEDQPEPYPTKELVRIDSKWKIRYNGKLWTPKGEYPFVVIKGRVYLGGGQGGRGGHVDIARGQKVEYAGMMRFGSGKTTAGNFMRWDNGSGHFQCPAAFHHQAPLPQELFTIYTK